MYIYAKLKNWITKLFALFRIARQNMDVASRLYKLERRLQDIGFDYVRGRLDYRLIRLEMLLYYQDREKYEGLDAEAKAILAYMKDAYFAEHCDRDRFYPLDKAPSIIENEPFEIHLSSQGSYCVRYNDLLIHIADFKDHARAYWQSIVAQEAEGSPHRYIDDNAPGFTFPDNAILVDVGAAEGFFTAKYLDKITKAYIFETDKYWVAMLKRTFSQYKDKVEIIAGFVGDKAGQINLDEFFSKREKPTFVKIDVEGAEGSVLRSMTGMLQDKNLPLQVAVCLYHRQEDEMNYTAMLKNYFQLSYSKGYYWHMPDPRPPYFRRGVLRAGRSSQK